MARPQRIEYEGAVYHVTVRGNEKKAIFTEDNDRERFIKVMEDSVQRFDVRLYLFCLMTNHVHLVLETPRGNLSRFMQRLQTAYTTYFNKRHRRSGHLMQGRYGACLVQEDEYILKLSRYVHLNPVFVKSIKSQPIRERIRLLRQYPWSSYRSYIGKCKPLAMIDHRPILTMMSKSKAQQRRVYQRFVESGIVDIDAAFIEDKKASRLCVGSEDFRLKVKTLYQEQLEAKTISEDISFRRTGGVVPIETILEIVCDVLGISRQRLNQRIRNSFHRAIASRMLCGYGGLTQREVADLLGLRTGAAVSHQILKLTNAMQSNRQVTRQVTTIEERLKKEQ